MGGYLSQGSVLGSAPVKQRGGKTCTVEATATRAERKTGTKDSTGKRKTGDTRHRRPHRGATGKRKQEQSFSCPVSCAVLGPAPLFYTPAVFRPWGRHSGVADCPLASADTSGPVTRVLHLLEIVDELVGTVVASASWSTAPPMPRQVVV